MEHSLTMTAGHKHTWATGYSKVKDATNEVRLSEQYTQLLRQDTDTNKQLPDQGDDEKTTKMPNTVKQKTPDDNKQRRMR